jgi:hypothetical protein
MFGLPILEVAIGLSFLYLLLALICTAVNETIAGITRRRAGFLEKGVNSLLGDDPNLKRKLFDHPLIASLERKKNSRPSYLPASKFALALSDVVTGSGKDAGDAQALREGISSIKSPSVKASLSAVLADSGETRSTNQQKIEAWYNECMDRVSGWYKRRTVLWIWILAATVTIYLNADSIRISKILWTNQAVRAAVIESAKSRAQTERPEALTPLVVHPNTNAPKTATPVALHHDDVLTEKERAELSDLTGWADDINQWTQMNGWQRIWHSFKHIPGWLLTIIAVSLGAPFWFDMLNRFMNIRSAGRAPDESRDKSSSARAATQVVEVRR